MGIMRTLKINGEVFNITPVVPASSVTLLASAWVSGGTSHYQVVELPGVTSHTKVDLQPTPEQLEEFHTLTLAFVAENENGVVTVYAIGDKPTGDHTIQTTLIEVEREGKIRGNTVGTTVPRTDFNQTDSAQADYLFGREKIVQSVNGITPDANGNVVVPGGSGGGSGGEVFVPKAQVTQTANGATITITDQHGTSTATITNGEDGKDGQDGYTPVKGKDYFDGKDGQDGSPGKDGTSATHSWNGTVLTVTSASGTSAADLKGAKGDKGDSIKGDTGSPGADGVSPTVAVSKSGKVTTISITDKNGTKTATINDGADGSAGSAGKDGTSVTVKSVSESTADGGSNVVTFSDGKTVTIKNGSKGSTGANGTNGKTPVKGTDYFTEADKAEMVNAVIAALPVYNGEVV